MRQSFEPLMSDYVGASFEVAGQFNPPLFPCGHADPGAGLMTAAGMLMALIHRQRTGEGQFLESPQLSAAMQHMAHVVRDADGVVHGAVRLDPLQMGVQALDRLYEASDGWLCLVARSDRHLRALGEVLCVDLLADPRFATAEARQDNDYALVDAMESRIRGRGQAELVEALRAADVPVAAPRMKRLREFYDDPDQEGIGRVFAMPHERFGRVKEVDVLVRISDTGRVGHRIAPELGEHTEEILRDQGRTAAEIEELRAVGAIH
jgi:crotonobetainyl-CoA:carnitine CoA-transferase CaiB-like acyl-CoA transferase